MAQIAVTIDGKSYRIACEDGQEPQIERLAADLDQRITGLRKSIGEVGDMRLAIMGALMVADELHEARSRLQKAEAEAADLRQQLKDASRMAADGINGVTARVERIVRALSEPDAG
jgi:cell division protein ZapA